MTTWEVRHGDCRDVMRSLPADSVDAIVSDPPYGLAFMGKEWDHGVPGVEFWTEALRVAKPGAHLVAFGGTRTFHRLAVAIEDAGWEIRDCLSWLYGSGFPKSLDVGKAIDKVNGETDRLHRFTAWMRTTGLKAKDIDVALRVAGLISPTSNFAVHYFNDGQPAIPTKTMWSVVRPLCGDVPEWVDQLVERHEAEREVVGEKASTALAVAPGQNTDRPPVNLDITRPATDAAKQWDGWGTALKPAWEPIVLARKPLVGTVAANVTQYGTGGINVDGCRIGTDAGWSYPNGRGGKGWHGRESLSRNLTEPMQSTAGRWPANVCLDEDAAAMLDAQTGISKSVRSNRGGVSKNEVYGEFANASRYECGYADSGGASRFFYTAKASRREREAGLDGMPERMIAVSNGAQAAADRGEQYGEGTIGMNRPKHTTNVHPTVKPIALMRWLCRLVTPPGGLVLDPFNGSGSTGCAAVLEGFRYLGAELDADYVEIARKRIAHWAAQTPDPDLFG
jgi:DNA modification methylase